MAARHSVRIARIAAIIVAAQGLSPLGFTAAAAPQALTRPRAAVEASLEEAIAAAESEVDFLFCVEGADGRGFARARGGVAPDSALESASTSKLPTAVIILRQVEKGRLKLSDKPADLLAEWPLKKSHALSAMTLADLLCFTSGLENEHLLLNAKRATLEASALAAVRQNAGSTAVPGKVFYYSGSHLQVAALMAIRAGGFDDWRGAFDEFRKATGLFPASAYDLPSDANPRVAGGMHWTASDYMAFLRKLSRGELLGVAMMGELLRDRTPRPAVAVGFSPVKEAMGEDWHYGFGLWIETRGPDGSPSRVSCPGAYGAYPFWDREKGYFGLVARQGPLGSFPEGIALERALRPLVMEWLTAE